MLIDICTEGFAEELSEMIMVDRVKYNHVCKRIADNICNTVVKKGLGDIYCVLDMYNNVFVKCLVFLGMYCKILKNGNRKKRKSMITTMIKDMVEGSLYHLIT